MKASVSVKNNLTEESINNDLCAKTFEVRLYQPGDEKQIVELLDLVFDGWPKIDIQSTTGNHSGCWCR